MTQKAFIGEMGTHFTKEKIKQKQFNESFHADRFAACELVVGMKYDEDT